MTKAYSFLVELFFTLIQCKLFKQSTQLLISPSSAISALDFTAPVMLQSLNTSLSLRSSLCFLNAQKHIHAHMPAPLSRAMLYLKIYKPHLSKCTGCLGNSPLNSKSFDYEVEKKNALEHLLIVFVQTKCRINDI